MKNRVQFTDEVYLEGIRSQDQKVLASLYKLHYNTIATFIANNSGSPDDAKDIYQEAFMIFYEKVLKEDLKLTCTIKTFLYSICRKLWLQKLYERNKFPEKIIDSETFVEADDIAEECLEKEQQFEAMEMALNTLGDPCLSILKDFYFYSLSMDEITAKFGYNNADTAKNQKYKCLQRLKKLFFNSNLLSYEK
ncbi:MAG TPA: sigma-70 family RNA polymerase sigma factor [Cytophagaceae bacterium]